LRCASSNRARRHSLQLRRGTSPAAKNKPGRAVRIVGHEPCFEVADVGRAVSHYQRLGFTISYHDENYVFAHRDNLTIHLAHSDEPTTGSGALYIHVDDADRLAADWRAAGLNVIGPDDYDYGKHEGSHRDPDGNLLRFGSPLGR
jgi:catechol 2,3-dioxygenase-like lactoylglutathione lyase family enzyme